LSEADQFGIAFFDSTLTKFPASGEAAHATAEMKAAALAFVSSLSPGHGTCAKPALVQSLSYASQSTAQNRMIIHITDGFNTCALIDEVQYGQEILTEMQIRNTEHLPIHAIAVGPPGSINESWMRRLAEENGGQYVQVNPE
jgi:hypothetical protein